MEGGREERKKRGREGRRLVRREGDGVRGERRRKEGNGEGKKQPGTERKNERDRDSPGSQSLAGSHGGAR